ncbi:hypothetical protein APHAL10511_005564 [Amanita phalloides]|nr:hypothetical protein APHAL10511_005564 [Amanita phalloides]
MAKNTLTAELHRHPASRDAAAVHNTSPPPTPHVSHVCKYVFEPQEEDLRGTRPTVNQRPTVATNHARQLPPLCRLCRSRAPAAGHDRSPASPLSCSYGILIANARKPPALSTPDRLPYTTVQRP